MENTTKTSTKAIIAPMVGEILVRSILASENPSSVVVACINDEGAEGNDDCEYAPKNMGETSLL